MIRRPLAAFLVMLCATAAAPASACRYNAPAATRIGALQRSGYLGGVVVVRVLEAGYTAPARRDYHPWEARAEAVRVLRGPAGGGRFRFGRSGSSAACDDGLRPPARGELWVVYLARHDADGTAVSLSYPLALVRRIDPVLAPLLR